MYYLKRKKKDKKSRNTNLVAKLDKVFSEYIRLRDSKPYDFRYFKCISCGKIKPYDQCDCGHFHSRTHMSTRFDPMNANGECRACNRFSADHLLGYQKNLIAKIGQRNYDLLNIRAHETKKWHPFELEKMIEYYKALVQSYKSGKL